jgi:hypothetical protein
MPRLLAPTLVLLGGLLGSGSVLAQAAVSAAPVGGTSGSVSRPGWSAGQATNSEFNSMGQPMTRSEAIRRRSAAARAQAGQASAQPRQPARRRPATGAR